MSDRSAQTGELIDLIDRLEAILDGSDLTELEVQVGETSLLLRKPETAGGGQQAVVLQVPGAATTAERPDREPRAAPEPEPEATRLHAIVAPLTGIYYTSPSPGAAPYVELGAEIHVGQVIGLIEAMKLFNEIKSDVHGRVARMVAETGTLVKARQPLIEVEPT